MKQMIMLAVVALAFSSAHAQKSAKSALETMRTRAKETKTAEQTRAQQGRKEVKEATGDLTKSAAIEALSKSDANLKKDITALWNDKTVSRDHKEVTAELLQRIASAERTSEQKALDAMGAGKETVEARESLMALAQALLIEVKGDPARAQVAVEAAKVAVRTLRQSNDFVKADIAMRSRIDALNGEKPAPSREEMRRSCKRKA